MNHRGGCAIEDISHEGLRIALREEGVTFQRLKTWKASKDPRYAEKKARVERLYAIAGREAAPGPRPRMRATYTRTAGVRHLFAACELGEDKSVRSLYPPATRIAISCDNFSRTSARARTAGSGPGRRRTRYFTLDGTDHASHREQASMIRRYIIWRNNHAYDERLRRIVDKANVA